MSEERAGEEKGGATPEQQAAQMVNSAVLGALGFRTAEEKPADEGAQKAEGGSAEAGAQAAAAEEKPAEAAGQEQAEEKPAEEGVHPLLAMATGQAKEDPVPDEVTTWLKAQGVEDFRATMKEVGTLRDQYRETTEKLSLAAKDLEFVAKISPEVQNIIQMDLAGKDWKKEVMQRPLTDYRKTFEKQDRQALLNAYGSGRITSEMLEEYDGGDPDPRTKAAVDAEMDRIKILYERDRDQSNNYLEQQKKEFQQKQELRQKSREDTLQYAMNAVPGGVAYRQEIEQALDEFESNFLAADGVAYTAQAALQAWRLKHMDKILDMTASRAARQAREQADISALRRTAEKKPAPSGAQAGTKEISPDERARQLVQQGILGAFQIGRG